MGEFSAEYLSGTDEISVSFIPFNPSFTYDITFYKETLSTGVGVGTTSYGNIKKVGFATYIAASGITTTSVIQSIPFNEYKSGVMFVGNFFDQIKIPIISIAHRTGRITVIGHFCHDVC